VSRRRRGVNLAGLTSRFSLAVTLAPIIAIDTVTVATVTVATVILTIADILHLAVAVNRAP
jgi:hypothetical protein